MYKRILLKLSGESLMGSKQYGIDEVRLNEYAMQIKEIVEMGVQVGIVIGGGNIFRGLSGASKGFDRVKGDLAALLREDAARSGSVLDMLMIAKYFERIGDHAVNIAEWVAYSVTGLYKGEELQ